MLKVGLVGCGRIGSRHCDILTEGKVEGAQLEAVCDIRPERTRSFREKYQVPGYQSMREMVTKENLDLVAVCTESGNHAKHVIQIVQYGVHILVEKPMALTLDDANDMIKTCDHYGKKLFVVKQNRFNVPILKMREALEQGRFGDLQLGTIRVRWCRNQKYYDQDEWRGTWALDGGVLSQQASHHIDALEWMMGDVESVYAIGETYGVKIEVEDTASVLLKFTNGAMGVIEATTAIRPINLEGSITISGNNGVCEVGGFAMNEMLHWKFLDNKEGEEEQVLKDHYTNPPDVYGFGHIEYYNHVVDCINNNSPALVDGLEGRRSLELISAIYESIETGKEVKLKFKPKKCKLGIKNDN
jgi:UDP-N-acetyl-2-amino-2-deoxyglucuronate dehydrogenase